MSLYTRKVFIVRIFVFARIPETRHALFHKSSKWGVIWIALLPLRSITGYASWEA